MKVFLPSALVLLSLSLSAAADSTQKVYKWVDKDGVVQFGDSIPAQYSDIDRHVLNEHGVTVDVMRGRKSDAELAEEARQAEIQLAMEQQKRADSALLATYLTVEEIELHRDRRIQLFQAQSRVTELFLKNQRRRLDMLLKEASRYSPYSEDPDAPMIERDLEEDITETRDVIARHETNLEKFQTDEASIVARFDGDIDRFKTLKGIN